MQENSNPKDLTVVSFHNSTDFDFTPEMGCMYDGRPINDISGSAGIKAGETMVLPYHVGHQLAINLAKRVLNTSPSATVDKAGIPTGVPVWSADRLEEEKNKYLKDLYQEEKPVAQNQTDALMAKVEEYKGMVDKLLAKDSTISSEQSSEANSMTAYQDKQEVIAELEKREIKFDRRSSKESLEKLLV